MKERVLITGASGFIGHHLIQAAQAAGLEVQAAVRPSSDLTHLKEQNLTFVYPDFSSKEALQRMLEEGGYAYVIHAAGATRAKDQQTYNRINAEYTLRLVQAAQRVSKPVKRFVFMSSLAALGPIPYDAREPITETTRPQPLTSYGKSKLLAEQYVSNVQGLPLTIIRPTAVYGPRERDLFILFKTLHQRLDLYIGRSPQRLSFVYVKDLAEVTIAALLQNHDQNRIYNISDGEAYNRYALADLFQELSGTRALRLHLPVGLMKGVAGALETGYSFSKSTPVLNPEKLRELMAPNWICSIEAARRDLNYQPKYGLKQGLDETLRWYRANQWL
ncbi:nucleoside-diphosphate-sugar epimerase [Larkinella arboricola]|uniref:Nucleoside-diphosphate-sugar epimerase n=1 Tax=Larkinella arboricola TaxID=643671 RepID=A0A327WP87_LARAB|nr:NAD-dependent epimerase/dehydratase family protein [Larkinella arboricola]RAJ92533.1 nucleoside-diphosphate-sugar epimerase [Larkinella arboricola]